MLRKQLMSKEIDIIHAHYSLSGIMVSLASIKGLGCSSKKIPVVVSLMGSDVKGAGRWLGVIRFLVRWSWDATVVKSRDMKVRLGLESPMVIPNGVNIQIFKPMSGSECRLRLGLSLEKNIILFGADPTRKVKNFPLAEDSVAGMSDRNCQLIALGSVPHAEVPVYLNACDVLLLTSKWEGSPNIVKEAMACGTPVVSTDVGDVRWLLEGLKGCFVTSQDTCDIRQKLERVLDLAGKTGGRERLVELGLDSVSVANRLINLYLDVLGYC